MIKVIIDEMLKGNFSFLILIVGVLQLVVMIRSQRRKRGKGMTPQVYESIKELSYIELLNAIDNMREKIYEIGDEVDHADFMYYIALVQELDNRGIEE